VIVDKTAGEREREAMALLVDHIRLVAKKTERTNSVL
jgi:hypothetical protein